MDENQRISQALQAKLGVKRIDTFLADAVFKDASQLDKPLEQQEEIAQSPAPAALETLTPGVVQISQVVGQQMKPLIEVMIGFINNQKELALAVEELSDKVNGKTVPVPAPANDVAMADAVLASVAKTTIAGNIESAGPTNLLKRAEKPAEGVGMSLKL